MAHDALHVYQVIPFRSLDAALPYLHFRKRGGEDYVVMVTRLINGVSLFKHGTKAAAAASVEFAFPVESYFLASPLWANVLGQRFPDAVVRCATHCMYKTRLLKVQIPLHALQRSSRS